MKTSKITNTIRFVCLLSYFDDCACGNVGLLIDYAHGTMIYLRFYLFTKLVHVIIL